MTEGNEHVGGVYLLFSANITTDLLAGHENKTQCAARS
jgi:hypothetical protein